MWWRVLVLAEAVAVYAVYALGRRVDRKFLRVEEGRRDAERRRLLRVLAARRLSLLDAGPYRTRAPATPCPLCGKAP